jgi:hypothetical protein
MSRKQNTQQNRNAIIRARETRNGKWRTETARRDPNSISMAVSTNPRTNTTALFIDLEGPFQGHALHLNGSEARTLYRLLQKHYEYTGKVS